MESTQPIIAVAGATSKQGRSVVKTLLASGKFRVRALTRTPSSAQAQELAGLGAEIIPAPLTLGHEDAWDAAFTGAWGAFLMTPPTLPNDSHEYELGCRLADAVVRGGVEYLVFSTLENVAETSSGELFAPHFTDKARVADYICTLDVEYAFIMLSFFYTNLMEYYPPHMDGDELVLPIYLPEDFHAPFVDPLTATGPAVLEIFTRPEYYRGQTLPVVGDIISPREIVETFQRVTGIKAKYGDATTREGMLRYLPDFANNELHLREVLGMVNYAVNYGYFRPERDLEWSRRIDPQALTWEQFLRVTNWCGEHSRFSD